MEKTKLRSYIYNAVIILLLIAGIVYVVLQFTHFGHVEYTDNTRVCQYIAPQNTRVQGFVREIRFEAYQHVNEGDTLVILEDSEYKLRLAQARSDLARAEQQSKQAGSSVLSAARRLELRQNEVYGSDPEYQAFVKKTPILLPFLPIYSVVKYKWLQA